MFKVECPGCKAPYQVDERRVPLAGLKMRCPKCGTSFKVDPPVDPRRTGPSPVLGADEPSQAAPVLGVSAKSAMKSTMLGVAPGLGVPRPQATPPTPPRPQPKIEFGDDVYGEVDLPTIGSPGARKPEPAASFDVELPSLAPSARQSPGKPPIPRRAAPSAPEPVTDFGEIDLPAPAAARPVRPAPGPPPPPQEFGEIDLPMVGRAERERARSGAGRPVPELDLPAAHGARGAFGEIDLPSLSGGGQEFGEVDLPELGHTDLPSPGSALPALAGRAELPSPAANLPAAAAGLPASAAALPSGAAGLPSGAAGLPGRAAGLPARREAFDAFDAPSAPAPPLPASSPTAATEYGGGVERVVRQAGGGTSYGEVNLEGGAVPPSAIGAVDDLEFGAIVQERQREQAPAAPAVAAPAVARAAVPIAGLPPIQAAPRRRVMRALVAVLVVVVLGGGALALVPSVGPFGFYFALDHLKAGEYRRLLADKMAGTHARLAEDTFPAASGALEDVERARARAKRVKGLAAYAALLGYLRELRFGSEPEIHARSGVLLDELNDAHGVDQLPIAQAARSAANGEFANARQRLDALLARDPRNVDVLTLRGELELRAHDPKAAVEAWKAAGAVESSARTTFGLARAFDAAGDNEAAQKQAQATLDQNKAHVGARILLARITGRGSREHEASAIKTLEEIVRAQGQASPEEIVSADTLLGDIHLARSRVTHAERAYAEALKINPKAARALAGIGDALYRAGRYSEALARFEAAEQADPEDLVVQVGIAKTKLSLERMQDAMSMMKKLRARYPKEIAVNYMYGAVADALGNRKDAEEAYRAAIREAPKNPDVVSACIALAMLLNQQGRVEEAQKVLADAQSNLPDSPAIHEALGDLSLSQGRYEDAVREFNAALELDKDDISAKFKLGIGYRRNRQFDEATKAFEAVAAIDNDYPGLALERGVLYEASGRIDEALSAYSAALAKAPNDPDLMLRVGCSKVSAGRGKEAEEMLRKVLGQRPNSAETNHCLGRALLVEGKNLAEALKLLERAVELDPNRAEYWLYVGWAANEADRRAQADNALKKALELDQGLADAYWQRGLLETRDGAVKDAIADLHKALELRPSRFEAHAALAEALYNSGREKDALAEWQIAIAAQGDNANWHFRYGKLLQGNHRDEQARAELATAIELAEAMDPKPRWLWEAHHALALALGMRQEAVKHWKAFLELGPRESAYRAEAKQMLKRLGQPWSGD